MSINKHTDFALADHRIYINFNNVDWDGFGEVTDSRFTALLKPTNEHFGERQFHKLVAAAEVRSIMTISPNSARGPTSSPSKSRTTLFTIWKKEVKLQIGVHVDGTPILSGISPQIFRGYF